MHLVIFDLETTGLSPARHEIIQIAAIRMRAGRILTEETFATFVQPTQPIPAQISGYTGITRAHVGDAPRPAEALVAFSRFVGDATLVAHNGHRFDLPFIHATCARHALPVRPVTYIDSLALSRQLWGGRGGHGLDAVMARLCLSLPDARRHDARGDVQILAETVRQMWSQLSPDFQTCPVTRNPGSIAQ
ncbi:MAG: 3'-5' exonuclease [Undibacterium sp.]|nr:3'-5' exonuclease [Opitutaceae bacterium]